MIKVPERDRFQKTAYNWIMEKVKEIHDKYGNWKKAHYPMKHLRISKRHRKEKLPNGSFTLHPIDLVIRMPFLVQRVRFNPVRAELAVLKLPIMCKVPPCVAGAICTDDNGVEHTFIAVYTEEIRKMVMQGIANSDNKLPIGSCLFDLTELDDLHFTPKEKA